MSTDLLSGLSQLFTSQKNCDVVFIVGDSDDQNEFKAHKFVLSTVSDVFSAMFDHTGRQLAVEKNSDGIDVVRIPDVKPEVFTHTLSHIYGVKDDKFPQTIEEVTELAYVAEKYNLQSLTAVCDDLLERQSEDHPNPMALLTLALDYHLFKLRYRILDKISRNAGDIFKAGKVTDVSVDAIITVFSAQRLNCSSEISLLDYLVSWSQERCRARGMEATTANVREMLLPVAPHIPYIDMEKSHSSIAFLVDLLFGGKGRSRRVLKKVRSSSSQTDNLQPPPKKKKTKNNAAGS